MKKGKGVDPKATTKSDLRLEKERGWNLGRALRRAQSGKSNLPRMGKMYQAQLEGDSSPTG